MLHIKFGFDWPWQAVSEKNMFEYYGHTHIYSPGAGADNPLGPKYFHKHEYSVHLLIPSKFLPLIDIFLLTDASCLVSKS